MLYPSGMLVVRPAADGTGTMSYTKHYFAGSQRVSSKIGTTTNLGTFLQDWTLQENASGGAAINLVGSSHAQLTKAETGVNKVYTAFAITPAPIMVSNPAFVPPSWRKRVRVASASVPLVPNIKITKETTITKL